jgi:hypothetical protein
MTFVWEFLCLNIRWDTTYCDVVSRGLSQYFDSNYELYIPSWSQYTIQRYTTADSVSNSLQIKKYHCHYDIFVNGRRIFNKVGNSEKKVRR